MSEETKEIKTDLAEKVPATKKEQENKPKEKLSWDKKPKYNGAFKKRKWNFNRRDDSDEKRVRTNPEERVKKRKYCMLMAFGGAKYFGMQRNPGVNTIEAELLKALHKTKMINDEGFNQPQMIHFQRAARTDKGVSAVRQCCSMKLPEEVDLDQLNNVLPPEIKVFCLKRVTKGFNAKDQCNSRTYSYTLPTIAFADDKSSSTEFRVTPEILIKVNETLKLFEGTRNFHNFTSRKAFADPSATRFIYFFKCDEPFISKDVEFCIIHVKGQSFMLHQIRKMIGLTLAVVRGIAPVETIQRSFKENRLDIPMAPGLGLVLEDTHYDGYNNRYGEDGMHEILEWKEYESAIQEFRGKFINPLIIDTEIEEQPMIKWLETLPYHSYDEREILTKPTNKKFVDEDDEIDDEIVAARNVSETEAVQYQPDELEIQECKTDETATLQN